MAFLKAAALGLSLLAALTGTQAQEKDQMSASTTTAASWERMFEARSPVSNFVGMNLPNMHAPHPIMNDDSPPYSLPLAAASMQPHCLTACLSPLQLTGATNCSAAYMTEDCACLVAPAAVQAAITHCVSALCPSAPSSSFSMIGVSGGDPTLAANIAAATSLYSSYCLEAYGPNTMASAYDADSARGGQSYTGTVVTATATSDAGAGGVTGVPTAPTPAPTTAGVPDSGTGVGTGAGPVTPTLEIPVDPTPGPGGAAGTPAPDGPPKGDVPTPSVMPFAGPNSAAWRFGFDELSPFSIFLYTVLISLGVIVFARLGL